MDKTKLTMFIYLLGRDHVSLGTIEEIMLGISDLDRVNFSNTYLEQYARDVAERLTNDDKNTRMKRNG